MARVGLRALRRVCLKADRDLRVLRRVVARDRLKALPRVADREGPRVWAVS